MFFQKTPVKLTILPDASARTCPGFHGGALTLTGTAGETVGTLIERFNTYRGPDNQITHVWNTNGSLLPFSTVIHTNLTCILKKTS